jgi:hypothetical protein
MTEQYGGGCLCGEVRYEVKGEPDRAAICHCRYCQLRTGAPFGSLVYFSDEQITTVAGTPSTYSFTSESGSGWTTSFCATCATTLYVNLEKRPGLTAISYGTFDPPTFHFPITREVFTRSKASFIGDIDAEEHHDTIMGYEPTVAEDERLSGKGTG